MALQTFPAAVSVVAVRTAEGAFMGTTATAATVLTLEPPTMLVCINRKSAISAELERCGSFSINVLRATQEHIAAACSGGVPHAERERIGDWHDDAAGVPVLGSAQASIVCTRAQFIGYGSHNLIFGLVSDVRSTRPVEPLLYVDRAYGGFAALNEPRRRE